MPTSLSALVRALIAVWITAVLARAAWTAWQHRGLVRALWGNIGLRTVGRALGLVVVVLVVASALLAVPGLDIGLGTLLRFEANAVFTPLEQAAGMAGPAPPSGPDWVLAGLTTGFLGGLALLIPWLAFIEEEVFRAGLEAEGRIGQVWSALRFGLAHLVMLVPVGATLAIALAGWVYGRRYLSALSNADRVPAPHEVVRHYRPGRRGAAALHGRAIDVAREPGRARLTAMAVTSQAAGVAESARLHAAFNLIVVGLVWAAIVTDAMLR